jgi:hypothetical protein
MSDTQMNMVPRGKAAPYVPYPSFKTLMQELHEHKVPSRIDRSVLKRFSGITGTQLMTTMRFLGLMDDKSHPTQRLHELVAAYGTAEWSPRMIAVLQAEYAPLFGLDLGNATPSHFDEVFRKAFPGADSVVKKSIAFFLSAAKDAGIVISDRVLHGRKPRAANGAPRRQKKKEDGAAAQPATHAPKNENVTSHSDFMNQLLAKFPPFDPGWSPELKAEWFKGFQTFMAHAKEGQKQ